jgi:hypothetical protein
MKTTTLFCSALALAMAGTASAKDFPLQFKTLKADQVMEFPGGFGSYGQVRAKADRVLKEPKAVSEHPLYGRWQQQEEQKPGQGWLFRLDESKGDGKGYDRLILDLNQNGDLTDDPVFKAGSVPKAGPSAASREEALFGPIEMPALGKLRPVYYAQAMIYNRQLLTNQTALERSDLNMYFGMLRFKAGWYLETTVILDGVKRKVGLIDGNANGKLGDAWKPQYFRNEPEDKTEAEEWYFLPGDSFLVDRDGSGKFEGNPFGTESCPWGPILYLGATPLKAAMSADYTSLQVEPWPGPLAELAIQPRGEFVRALTLAWESSSNQWQLLEPQAAGGKVQVPAGRHRLYQCLLEANRGKRDAIMTSAGNQSTTNTLSATAGRTTVLVCGAPLELKVSASRDDLPSPVPPGTTEKRNVVQISASVVGAGGEAYASFGKGKDYKTEPPEPVVTISRDGKRLASANLEFG